MRRTLQILAALSLLGGCMQTGTIPVRSDAGPGSQILSAFDAGVIFADGCLIRGERFEDVVEGLRVHGFTQNASTGTFYHNRANLSVKVQGGRCSMVYGAVADVDEVITGLARGTASMVRPVPPGVDVTSQLGPDGIRYFRLAIEAPVPQTGEATG